MSKFRSKTIVLAVDAVHLFEEDGYVYLLDGQRPFDGNNDTITIPPENIPVLIACLQKIWASRDE